MYDKMKFAWKLHKTMTNIFGAPRQKTNPLHIGGKLVPVVVFVGEVWIIPRTPRQGVKAVT